jgi:Ca-activated chloride channel family protein
VLCKKLFYVLLIFGILKVQAQEKIITGIVSETSGVLPGVNWVIKGTETDFDSTYSIKAAIGDTLVLTYLGFKTSIINVTLIEDSQALKEIVIVGYVASKRLHTFGYATSTIKSNQKNRYHTKIRNALCEKILGVQVSRNNNGNKDLIIRGANTASQNKQPLYIVDGIPIKNNYNSIVKNIDLSTIEKVTVYKESKAKKHSVFLQKTAVLLSLQNKETID